jgi:hypothetical protein
MRIELPMNRKLMRVGRLASCVVFLVMVCAFVAAFHLAFADQPVGNSAKGVSAPLDYYPPPHQLQVRSFLEAAASEMGPNGTAIFHDAKLQTFHENGSKEMIVSAPQCLYDYARRTINSTGALQVETWDERQNALLVQGTNGFYWQQTNALLIVSNKQITTVRGPLTNSFTP